jgi:hypothetical protein
VEGSDIISWWGIPGIVSLHEQEAAHECTVARTELPPQSTQELLITASFLGSLDSILLAAATKTLGEAIFPST